MAGLLALVVVGTTACEKLDANGFTSRLDDTGFFEDTSGDGDAGIADVDAIDDTVDSPPPPQTISTSCMGELDQNFAPNERVVEDICPHLEADGEGRASLVQITDESQLLTGPAAQGRIGDWLIDTGAARFIIAGPSRHAQPCPYGGTLIDASYKRADGTWTPDNVGEMCLLIQLGRTLRPTESSFEVVRDGSDGGSVVLAVTSEDALSDWLSVQGKVDEYVGDLIELPISPEEPFGLTITQYFIAAPGANALTYLTSVRNDSDEEQHVLAGELLDSGGDVEFFNPESTLRGFGYGSVNPEPLSMLAFVADDTTHAYVTPIRGVKDNGRIDHDATYIAVSGVAVPMLGVPDITKLLTSPRRIATVPGVVSLDPGFWHTWERRFYVGTGDISTVTDVVYEDRDLETGRVSGRVVDPAGDPIADVPVAAVRTIDEREQAETRFRTDADGRFSGALPVGSYTLYADAANRLTLDEPTLDIAAGDELETTIELSDSGQLQVDVIDGVSGAGIPAKVTVFCEGACPRGRDTTLRDVTRDAPPADVAGVFHIGPEGTDTLELPPGDYHVVVSRGMAWTVWPRGSIGMTPTESARSVEPLTVTANETTAIDAELFPAVDTTGWLGADFHVHAINSPDSPVANHDRVRSFLAAGVDVLIPTDHDFITDLRPYIEDLGAEDVAASMIGVELTTFDYGHYNAFPLEQDPMDRQGGAVDWAVDQGPPLKPVEIFDALQAFPGEQVVQLNHAGGGSGYFSSLQIDAARSISTADPTQFRFPATEPGPNGGTGLWTTNYTAMEVLNGLGMSKFWSLMNWWFAMVANGHAPTLTAVSDSHKLVTDVVGTPRTWVYVGSEYDSAPEFDEERFAVATNEGRAFGSSGPFVQVDIVAPDDGRAMLGETLRSGPGESLSLQVDVQIAGWMHVDRVTLYGNVLDSAPPPGEVNSVPPTPIDVVDLVWEASHAVGPNGQPLGAEDPPEMAVGRRQTVTFEVSPDTDSFYVVVVDAKTSQSMHPVNWGSSTAFAYTNPVFVDVDGGGFDPPGAIPPEVGAGGSAGLLETEERRALRPEDLETIRRAHEREHGH